MEIVATVRFVVVNASERSATKLQSDDLKTAVNVTFVETFDSSEEKQLGCTNICNMQAVS